MPKLKELNLQLKKRMNQLDLFYHKFYADERIHLFHRLKLQIKKVLSKPMEEIERSYIQAQSLDVSKVREELALIESTLEREYSKEKEKKEEMASQVAGGSTSKKSLI